MNAVEIEAALSDLALEPFDQAEFPYQFLAAFGNKDVAIKRLRTGNNNTSDVPRGVLQRNNIHLATCEVGNVGATLQALRSSPATTKAKAKFILATDGETLEAEELIIGETANFLLRCGDSLLKYVEYSNNQIGPDSEAFLSANEIQKIDSLFRELGDNFFPMAHTTEPLRNLKIVNEWQYENLNNQVEYFLRTVTDRCENNLAESIAINERNLRFNHELIDELRNLREEIRTVINP